MLAGVAVVLGLSSDSRASFSARMEKSAYVKFSVGANHKPFIMSLSYAGADSRNEPNCACRSLDPPTPAAHAASSGTVPTGDVPASPETHRHFSHSSHYFPRPTKFSDPPYRYRFPLFRLSLPLQSREQQFQSLPPPVRTGSSVFSGAPINYRACRTYLARTVLSHPSATNVPNVHRVPLNAHSPPPIDVPYALLLAANTVLTTEKVAVEAEICILWRICNPFHPSDCINYKRDLLTQFTSQ